MCSPNAPPGGNPAARGAPNVQGRTPINTDPNWSQFNSADNPDATSILNQRAAYEQNGGTPWTPSDPGTAMSSTPTNQTKPLFVPNPAVTNPGINPAGRATVDVQGRPTGPTTSPIVSGGLGEGAPGGAPGGTSFVYGPGNESPGPAPTPNLYTPPSYATKPLVMNPLMPGGGGAAGPTIYGPGSSNDIVTNALMKNYRGYY